MASLLKIKPNRREIINLLAHTIQRKNKEKANEIAKEANAIKNRLDKEQAEFTQNAVAKAIGSNGKLATLVKQAQKMGFKYDHYFSGRDTVHISLRMDGIQADLKGMPEMSKKDKDRYDTLSGMVRNLSNQRVSNESIMEILMDANEETKAEMEAMAEIISKNLEQEAVKMLEGPTE